MAVLSNTGILAGASGAGGGDTGYNLKRSTRFNDDDSAHLNRTPSSVGSRATWTLSFWIKRGNLGSTQYLFAAKDSSNYFELLLNSSDQLAIYNYQSSGAALSITNRLFRDTSAFYHILYTYDTSQSGTDKLKLFVNGTQETSFGTDNRSSTGTSYWNKDVAHTIGSSSTPNNYFDGLISDVNFVDGTALDATSFGETDATTGQWVPKEYTHTTSDFHTVNDGTVWSSNNTGGTNSGLGWDKGFNGAGPSGGDGYVETSSATTLTLNKAFTTLEFAGNGSGFEFNGTGVSVGGAYTWTNITSSISSPLTTIKITSASVLSAVRVDGQILTDSAGDNSFHLAMDPAESGTIYSDSLTSSSGTWHNASFEPDQAFDGSPTTGNYCQTNAGTSMTFAPSSLSWSSSIEVMTAAANTTAAIDGGSSVNLTADTWTTVASGAGSISTSLIITHGTAASLKGIRVDGKILVDHTAIGYDSSGQKNHWRDNNLVAANSSNVYWSSNLAASDGFSLAATRAFDGNTGTKAGNNLSSGGGTLTYTGTINVGSSIEFLTGIQNTVTINGSINAGTASTDPGWVSYNSAVTVTSFVVTAPNTNGYRADLFAVKVDGVVLINAPDLDLLADTPGAPYDNSLNGGGNYATLNPLDNATTLSNGNLTITGSGSAFKAARSTIGMKTGKWYFEGTQVAISSATSSGFGIWDDTKSTGELNSGGGAYGNNYLVVYDDSGNMKRVLGGTATTIEAGSISAGDILGFALDLDNGTLKVHKNGTYLNSGNSIYDTWPSDRTYFFGGYEYSSGNTLEFNFGARAFAYTPPTGYKALNTYNLSEPTIVDGSDHLQSRTRTGGGTTQNFTTLKPGLVWEKNRTNASAHYLYDVVRGDNKYMDPSATTAEATGTGAMAFSANSYEVNSSFDWPNTENIIDWVWDAGSSTVSNTDGSITSSVRANPSAGFSIVSYSGDGSGTANSDSGDSFGHGLNAKPSLVICKRRTAANGWPVYHGSTTLGALSLNGTAGVDTASYLFAQKHPDSSVVYLGNNPEINKTGDDYIAYVWSEVAGYSRFSSFTGNGSADGPFVYCGFKPAFLIWKRSDGAANWYIYDSSRDTYNVVNKNLEPNTSDAENTLTSMNVDFTSNGFKIRGSDGDVNASGGTYVFCAFASNPFKYSNAR